VFRSGYDGWRKWATLSEALRQQIVGVES